MTGGLLSARLSAVDWAMETFRGGQGGAGHGRRNSRATRAFGGGAGAGQIRRPAWARRRWRPMPARGFAPGTVFLAVDVQGAQHTEKVMLTPDRRRTREFSVISLLNLLRRVLTS